MSREPVKASQTGADCLRGGGGVCRVFPSSRQPGILRASPFALESLPGAPRLLVNGQPVRAADVLRRTGFRAHQDRAGRPLGRIRVRRAGGCAGQRHPSLPLRPYCRRRLPRQHPHRGGGLRQRRGAAGRFRERAGFVLPPVDFLAARRGEHRGHGDGRAVRWRRRRPPACMSSSASRLAGSGPTGTSTTCRT